MKQEDSNCGVYMIKNLVNGKCYIGSSARIPKRVYDHFAGYGSVAIKRAVKKYGKMAFEVSILAVCESDRLLEEEAKWLMRLKPAYNSNGFIACGNKIGIVISDKTRAKMSISAKKRGERDGFNFYPGRKHSAKTRAKIARSNRGRVLTVEHRAKIRNGNLGRKMSEEAKAKIAAAQRGRTRVRPEHEKIAIKRTSILRWKQDPARRTRHSELMLSLWKDPTYRLKVRAGKARGK